MKPVQDAPQRSKTALAAPAIILHKKAGRAERVTMVFEEKYDHLCSIAVTHLNYSEVFAEDVVADVFVDALTIWSTERYEGINDLEAYIARCVIYKSKNFRYRNRRLINIQDLPIDTLSTTNPMMKLDFDMDEMMKMLGAKQGDAFSLFMNGYSHEEIAQMLNLNSQGASRNLIYNAKKKLKKLWNELLDDDPEDPETSGTSIKAHKNTSRHHNRPLSDRPVSLPKIKDLLGYLSGTEQPAKTRNAILLWLLKDEYAFDILSGLKYILDRNTKKSIEVRFKKGKENLRERLNGIIQSKNISNNQFLSNTNIENKPTQTSIFFENNGDWIEIPDDTLLNKLSFNPTQIKVSKKTRLSNKVFLDYMDRQRLVDSEQLNDKRKFPHSPKDNNMTRRFNSYLISIGIIIHKDGIVEE
jgi:RNA polymerase sigma factor (sigma-70 family)